MDDRKFIKEAPSILIILAMIIFGIVAYPYLPDKMPTHWNFQGEPDAYSNKLSATFSMPLITLGVYLLLLVIPFLDPRRENYQKFAVVYQKIKFTLVLFFALFYTAILVYSLGYITDMSKIVIFIMSMLFVLLGNYFGKIRQNYFVGLKFPWTLADEDVWNKTHRLGGKLWVASGVIGMLSVFIGGSISKILFFAMLFGSTLATVIYSYVIYERKKKFIN